ncbi:MAG: HpcH/HpaI aldolase/citrate lyase family protein [Nitrososphaerales archaeon]
MQKLTVLLRRSNLIMPANRLDFVDKAWLRGADAITLDLEDSVSESKKQIARDQIKQSIPVVGKGMSDVLVRINNTHELLELDLKSSVLSGLAGIILPKAETVENIVQVDKIISELERERNIPLGKISINLVIETAKGVINALDLATSTSRIGTMSVGHEDLSLDLEIGYEDQRSEVLNSIRYQMIIVARAAGVTPLGLMGSVADLNLVSFRENAIRSKASGFKGAMAINPSQVLILNEVFSPTRAEVEESEIIIRSFEAGSAEGKGVVKAGELMIDKPVYLRARSIVERAKIIGELEHRRKQIVESSF